LVLAITQRNAVAAFVGARATNLLGPLLVEARPGISPEEAEAGRQQLMRLIAVLLDFVYLLMGYTLLRGPLLSVLLPISSPLAAAILASAPAVVVWVVLITRLKWIAGVLGLALGLVLGAPILLSLPLLQTALLQGHGWRQLLPGWSARQFCSCSPPCAVRVGRSARLPSVLASIAGYWERAPRTPRRNQRVGFRRSAVSSRPSLTWHFFWPCTGSSARR
jgi:hypothetical protein